MAAVIAGAVRLAIGGFGGTLSNTHVTDLGAEVLKQALNRAGVEAGAIQEIIMGNVVQAGAGIVADSIPCLAPGAHVLYTTCSLEPEENQSMPRWLEKWHGWKLVDESLVLPAGQPGDPPTSYHDGSYSALLRAR